MIIDLHNHTIEGSPDSKLKSSDLFQFARSIHIDGIGVTEHGSFGSASVVQEESKISGVLAFQGIEYSTEFAHLLVYGPSVNLLFPAVDDQIIDTGFLLNIANSQSQLSISALKNAIAEIIQPEIPQTAENILFHGHSKDCCIIFAHPFSFIGEKLGFNYLLKSWVTEGRGNIHMPAFLKYVSDRNPELIRIAESSDAFETINGCASPVENLLSRLLAIELGKPQTGGSDAHFIEMAGRCVTVFEKNISDSKDLVNEIKAGRVSPKEYLNENNILSYYSDYFTYKAKDLRLPQRT